MVAVVEVVEAVEWSSSPGWSCPGVIVAGGVVLGVVAVGVAVDGLAGRRRRPRGRAADSALQRQLQLRRPAPLACAEGQPRRLHSVEHLVRRDAPYLGERDAHRDAGPAVRPADRGHAVHLGRVEGRPVTSREAPLAPAAGDAVDLEPRTGAAVVAHVDQEVRTRQTPARGHRTAHVELHERPLRRDGVQVGPVAVGAALRGLQDVGVGHRRSCDGPGHDLTHRDELRGLGRGQRAPPTRLERRQGRHQRGQHQPGDHGRAAEPADRQYERAACHELSSTGVRDL